MPKLRRKSTPIPSLLPLLNQEAFLLQSGQWGNLRIPPKGGMKVNLNMG